MNEKQKEIFKKNLNKLREFVSNYDKESIDLWFGEYAKTKKDKKIYANMICNENYFFSYYSNSFNRKQLDLDSKKRHFAILNNFDFKEQLVVLRAIYHDVQITSDYFERMNLTKTELNFVKKDSFFGRILSKFFNEENFEELQNFKNLFGKNLLKTKYTSLVYYYKEENCFGMRAMDCYGVGSYITDDIIFNFTKNKKNYLENMKIELPQENRLNDLEKIIIGNKYLKEEDLIVVLEKINNYKIINLVDEINKVLPKGNNKKIIKYKI